MNTEEIPKEFEFREIRELCLNGNVEDALLYLNKIESLASGQNNKITLLQCQIEHGRIKAYQGDYEGAKLLTEIAYDKSKSNDYIYGQAGALAILAICNLYMGFISETLKQSELALTLFKQINSKRDIAAVLNYTANAHLLSGDYKLALKVFKESQEFWEELGERRGLDYCLNNQALIYKQIGDFDKALELYGQSLNNCKERNDKFGMSAVNCNLGWLRWAKFDLEEALHTFTDSISLMASITVPDVLRIEVQLGIAAVQADIENHREAAIALNKAKEMLEEGSSELYTAAALFIEGFLHQRQFEIVPAKRVYNKCLEKSRKINHFEYMLRALIQLAEVALLEYRATSDETHLNQMKEYIREASQLAKERKMTHVLIETTMLRALLLASDLDFHLALEELGFAVSSAEEKGLDALATKARKLIQSIKKQKETTHEKIIAQLDEGTLDEISKQMDELQTHLRGLGFK